MPAPNHGNVLPAILHERIAEQQEVSRFLHDTIAQDLVALSFMLSRVELMDVPEASRDDVHSAVSLIESCCRQVRIIDAMLASSIMDRCGAAESIEQLSELMRAETGLPITLDLDPAPPVSDDAQTLLLTVVRSCFAMVVRRRAEAAILIRLRNHDHMVILDIEISPPPFGNPVPWTLLAGCATAIKGRFAVQHNAGRFAAFLSLPEGEVE